MSFPLDGRLFDLAKSAAFRASEKVLDAARTRLVVSLNNLPRNAAEMASFDRRVKEEAAEELSRLQRELSLASHTALNLNDPAFLAELETTRAAVERLCRSLNSSLPVEPKKNAAVNGVAYLDLMLLSDCFIMLESAREELSTLTPATKPQALTCLENIRAAAKNVETIQLVKSLSATVDEREFLQILQTRAPQIYNQVKDLAAFAFPEADAKKGIFKKAFTEQVSERAIKLIKIYEEKQCPFVSLNDFYSDFKKQNLDVNASYLDVERALGLLVEHGLIYSVALFADGKKTVILKLDYQTVLDLVNTDAHLKTCGLTLEQLMQQTSWPKDYSTLVLEKLENQDVARKVLSKDNTARYYFPSM
ncbi:MAG: hypothetical protein NWF04_07300 [Candidatus Bathyarchaeota archaeon]|nr:hypothetical protein [Candidatus Bathyarchaeota archaeon]